MVILPGQSQPDGGMRSLDVVVEELAAGPDHNVVFDARWTMRESGRADITQREHIITDIPSLDSANVATGISNAIGTLADHVAEKMR
jgi:uncharacterized lipoprotein YmbA